MPLTAKERDFFKRRKVLDEARLFKAGLGGVGSAKG